MSLQISSVNTNKVNNAVLDGLINGETSSTNTCGCKLVTNQKNSVSDMLPNTPSDTRKSWFDAFYDLLFRSHAPERSLTVTTDEQNKAVVRTKDGYTIRFETKNEEWQITAPNGRTTRIWGDPHVTESDGDEWMFSKQSTFLFGNNKVTVEIVPTGRPDVTYSGTVTVYSGDERFTLTDIDKNKLQLSGWTFNGKAHDAALDDGDVYRLEIGPDGRDRWAKNN